MVTAMTMNIEARVTALENRVTALEAERRPAVVPNVSKQRGQSIVEFYREKSPKSGVDKVLTMAAYLHTKTNGGSFGSAEIKGLFRKVHQQKPRNVSDCVLQNVRKGYLAEEDKLGTDGQKQWYVTDKGLAYVESGFVSDA